MLFHRLKYQVSVNAFNVKYIQGKTTVFHPTHFIKIKTSVMRKFFPMFLKEK